MATTIEHRAGAKSKKTFAVVDNTVGNYEKHPFLVKKAKAAKALLKAVGLPGQLSKACMAQINSWLNLALAYLC
jgi:hypothetical protein